MARVLLKVTKTATSDLQIIEGKVSCIDPPAFDEIYKVEKEYYHNQNILAATAALPGAGITEAAKLKGKIISARRQ